MTYPTPGGAPGYQPPPERPAPPAWRPRAPACVALIGVCAALLVADYATGKTLWQAFALWGPAVARGQYWRILTNVLFHGDPLHLFFNMSVVWTLGRALEHHLGSGRFLLASLVTALGASSLVLALDFGRPTLGASGMILGWAGVMLPIATPEGRRGLRTWLVQIAVISLLPGVSFAGHLGGFLWGLPVGFALRGGPARFRWAAPLLVLLAAGACFAAVWLRVGASSVTPIR